MQTYSHEVAHLDYIYPCTVIVGRRMMTPEETHHPGPRYLHSVTIDLVEFACVEKARTFTLVYAKT